MGLFNNLFGGLFDFNKDGKTTWNEEWLSYKIYEDINEEDGVFDSSDSDDESDDDSLSVTTDDYDWRKWCEDGFLYDINPEDYETEYDYDDALEEAKNAWRNDCIDGSYVGIFPENYDTQEEYELAIFQAELNCNEQSSTGFGSIEVTLSVECPALDKLNAIKESDYPNKRQYDAAYTLANEFMIYSNKETEQKEKAVCHFILEQSSTINAANYLTVNDGFLFAQAVKDHFPLPVELPDEDAERKIYFSDMIKKIARKDIGLSLKIWDWCVEQFMPYAHFECCADEMLTCSTIDDLYDFPENFKPELVRYLGEHPAFCHALFRDAPEHAAYISELIFIALQSDSADTSKLIFEDSLIKADKDTDTLIHLISSVISRCNNYDELESMERFQFALFPLVLKYSCDELEEEIDGWKKEMAEYIRETEQHNKKYAFSRCNSWRKTVPDGKEFGLDVCNYNNAQKYLNDLNEKKYGWRKYYDKAYCFGLNPSDYETQSEFDAMCAKRRTEAKKAESEQFTKKQLEKDGTISKVCSNESNHSAIEDKDIYIYCGVVFKQNDQVYHYRTDDTSLRIGDFVIVPVGIGMKERQAKIVSVGQYTRATVPFPVEKTHFIIRKDNEKTK